MAEATLKDVIKTLQENQASSSENTEELQKAVLEMNKRLDAYFKKQSRKELDDLEDKKEAKAKKGIQKNQASVSSRAAEGLSDLAQFTLLGGVFAGFNTFVGAVTGFVGALEGLGPRLRDFKVESIRTSLLRAFGVDPETGKLLEDKDGKKPLITRIRDAYNREYNRILARFGLGPDGKFRDPTGRFRAGTDLQKTVRNGIQTASRILRTIAAPFSFLAITLPKLTILGPLKTLGTGIKAIATSKLAQTLLKFVRPLAIFISALDGLRNAEKEMEDREGFFNKYLGGGLGGFIAGSVGSFFGEFFNLIIRDFPVWIGKKIFGDEAVDENGKFRKDTDIGKFLEGYSNLDFNKLITDIIQTPFDFVASVLTFITGFFTDPEATLEERWNKLLKDNDVTSFTDLLFKPIDIGINWIRDAFGWNEPDEKFKLSEFIAEQLNLLNNWFVEKLEKIKKAILGDDYQTPQEKLVSSYAASMRSQNLAAVEMQNILSNDPEKLSNLFAKALKGEITQSELSRQGRGTLQAVNKLMSLQNQIADLAREQQDLQNEYKGMGLNPAQIITDARTYMTNQAAVLPGGETFESLNPDRIVTN